MIGIFWGNPSSNYLSFLLNGNVESCEVEYLPHDETLSDLKPVCWIPNIFWPQWFEQWEKDNMQRKSQNSKFAVLKFNLPTSLNDRMKSYHEAADCLLVIFTEAFIFTHESLKITQWLKSVQKAVFCLHGQPPTWSTRWNMSHFTMAVLWQQEGPIQMNCGRWRPACKAWSWCAYLYFIYLQISSVICLRDCEATNNTDCQHTTKHKFSGYHFFLNLTIKHMNRVVT